jgi:mannose-6-phosphate isomerase-like protein (cupin superfamily)
VKVIRSDGFRWDEVAERAYQSDDGSHSGVTRHHLLGGKPDEAALHFETRYFEVAPGGRTSLERHQHPHAVVVIRGSGSLVGGDESVGIRAFDCVYVAPDDVHQFKADRGEPLGFLCVVDRERDRPILVPL